MPDLIGLALLLLPATLYVAWRGLGALPIPGAAVAAGLLALMLLLAALLWFGFLRAIPPGEGYRPARVSGARILPGGPVR